MNIKQLIVFYILISFFSCNTKKGVHYNNNEDIKITDSIRVKKVLLKNDFSDALNDSRDFFVSKHNTSPKVIVVYLIGKTDNPTIEIETKINLYSTNKEKDHYSDLFFAACTFENTLVLFKGENNFNLFRNKLELTTDNEWFKFTYGGDKSSCISNYKLYNGELILIENFCFFDLLERR